VKRDECVLVAQYPYIHAAPDLELGTCVSVCAARLRGAFGALLHFDGTIVAVTYERRVLLLVGISTDRERELAQLLWETRPRRISAASEEEGIAILGSVTPDIILIATGLEAKALHAAIEQVVIRSRHPISVLHDPGGVPGQTAALLIPYLKR
jgi:hypothetical protein